MGFARANVALHFGGYHTGHGPTSQGSPMLPTSEDPYAEKRALFLTKLRLHCVPTGNKLVPYLCI
ncbi:uncharacterized protein TrAtP1_007721 [Trichoderma atroviride]|uniref:uncharacterized protein n=1 Tax=Hypocrea atroviridis TaxID=63577 RepID=UPI0033262D10|nr:hypothetical protein TrAtP1_007721 [Trichoderma atroviride]